MCDGLHVISRNRKNVCGLVSFRYCSRISVWHITRNPPSVQNVCDQIKRQETGKKLKAWFDLAPRHHVEIILAGTPTAVRCSGTALSTTAPAPILERSPIDKLFRMDAPVPIRT